MPPCQPRARPHSALRSSAGRPGSGSVFRSAGCPALPLLAPPSRWTRELAPPCWPPPGCPGSLLSGVRLPALRARLPLGAGAGPVLCPVCWSAHSSVTRPSARRLQALSCLPCVARPVCDLSLTGAPRWRPGPQPTPRPAQPSVCRAVPVPCVHA